MTKSGLDAVDLDLIPDGGLAALDRLRRPDDADLGTGTRYRAVTLDPNEIRLALMMTTERHVYGVKTPFYGRREVLEQLYNAVRNATTERCLHVVEVVGEAGVGKTRLLAEMFAIIDPRARGIDVLPLACSAAGPVDGSSVVAQLVRRRFAIAASDREAVAREKILEAIEPWVEARALSATARMMGYLAGLRASGPAADAAPGDMAQFHKSAVRWLVTLLRRDAERAPQIIVLHRAQHMSPASRAWFEQVVVALADLPVVIILIGEGAIPAELAERARASLRIDVAPLPDRVIEQQVRTILDRVDHLPDALVDAIVSRSGGSPRLAEENLRLLIQRRVLLPGVDRWTVDGSRLPSPVELAGTVEEASRARVAALEGYSRRIAEVASVFGYNFWIGGIVTILRALGDGERAPWVTSSVPDRIAAVLDELEGQGIIAVQAATTIDGEREYAFRHHRDRNLIYEELAGPARAEMHRLAAQWLSGLAMREPSLWHEVIGNHWDEGARPGDAAERFMRAAEVARDGYAMDAARALYRRALGLLTLDRAVALVRALSGFGEIASRTGDFLGARAAYGAMLDASALAGDVGAGADAWLQLGGAHSALGDYAPAKACLVHAESLYRRANDTHGVSAARDERARVVWLEGGPGAYDEALAHFEEALAMRRRLGAPRSIAQSLKNIANVCIVRGDLDLAQANLEEALSLQRQVINRAGEATCQVGLGAVHYARGDLQGALNAWRQGLELAEYAGDRDLIGALLNNIGEIELELGELTSAEVALTEAKELTAETGDQRTAADVCRNLAALAAARGDFDAAQALIQEALTTAEAIGSAPAVGQIQRTHADIDSQRAHAARDASAAGPISSRFVETIQRFEALGDQMERNRTVAAYAAHLARSGDADEARQLRIAWGLDKPGDDD